MGILNGGITTFLALVLLGFSQSHVFITFFKVFLLTVLFGLFHGIVFLPVLLSLLGPSHDEDEVPGDQSDPKIEPPSVRAGIATAAGSSSTMKSVAKAITRASSSAATRNGKLRLFTADSSETETYYGNFRSKADEEFVQIQRPSSFPTILERTNLGPPPTTTNSDSLSLSSQVEL